MTNRRDFLKGVARKGAGLLSLVAGSGLVSPRDSYADVQGTLYNGGHVYEELSICCTKGPSSDSGNAKGAGFMFYENSNGPAFLNTNNSISSVGVGRKNGNQSVTAKVSDDCTLSLGFWSKAKPGGFNFPKGRSSWVSIELGEGDLAIYKEKDWRCPVIEFNGNGNIAFSDNVVDIGFKNGKRSVTRSAVEKAPPGTFGYAEAVLRPSHTEYEYWFNSNGTISRKKKGNSRQTPRRESQVSKSTVEGSVFDLYKRNLRR